MIFNIFFGQPIATVLCQKIGYIDFNDRDGALKPWAAITIVFSIIPTFLVVFLRFFGGFKMIKRLESRLLRIELEQILVKALLLKAIVRFGVSIDL